MPVCNQCKNRFPYQMMIDGQIRSLRSRKYCVVCSPFKQHNTRPINHVTNVNCKSCGNSTERGRALCVNCYTKARRYKIKKAAVAYKGGKCERCGWSGTLVGYDFHHMDGEEKEFNICSSTNRKLKDIRAELDKCELLCVICHRIEHSCMNEAMQAYIDASEIDFSLI